MDEGTRALILVFCAFGAELAPIRARMSVEQRLDVKEVDGFYGRIGNTSIALAASGIGMRRARENARRVFDRMRDLDLVILTGVAGALADHLGIGHVILADRLMTRQSEAAEPGQVIEIPRNWFETLADTLDAAAIPFAAGPLLTVKFPIVTGVEKLRAGAQSGAIAVDMESAVIAAEAAMRGIPFVCMRTIMDTVAEDLAGARLADENGNIRPLRVAKALFTDPRLVPGVFRLVRNLRQATHAAAVAVEAVARRLNLEHS